MGGQFLYAQRHLTEDEALEILALRKAGMSATGICVAMSYFRDVHVSSCQVRYLIGGKAHVPRGKPPLHARPAGRRGRAAA